MEVGLAAPRADRRMWSSSSSKCQSATSALRIALVVGLILLAVTLREIEQLHSVLTARIAESSSVVDLLVEGVLGAIELVNESAVLRELLENPALLASEVSDQGLQALVEQLVTFVEPLAEGHHGSIRPDLDVGLAVECLVRTIASLVTMRVRRERDPDDLRRYLCQSLVPIFVPDASR